MPGIVSVLLDDSLRFLKKPEDDNTLSASSYGTQSILPRETEQQRRLSYILGDDRFYLQLAASLGLDAPSSREMTHYLFVDLDIRGERPSRVQRNQMPYTSFPQ